MDEICFVVRYNRGSNPPSPRDADRALFFPILILHQFFIVYNVTKEREKVHIYG